MAITMAGLLIATSIVCAETVSVQSFKLLNSNESSLVIDPDQAQDLLNIDVTPGGKTVKKRPGYGLFKALSTGQQTHGLFHFFDSTGNDVQVVGSSTSLYGIVADATPTQLVSSATLNSTWDCTDSQGNAYCVNSNRNAYIKTDGATKTWYSSPLGTMVDATPDRIAVSGVSGTPNTIYFSESGVFTNFVNGILVTSPFTEVIASQGSKITHIRQACGKLLWWKDQSFGYLNGSDQFTMENNIVSDNIGTFDNTSALDPSGAVWFRGQDGHVWKYDCSALTKESIEISPFVQASAKRVSNLWTQTTQADFEAGASSPTASLSTTILPNSVVPSSVTLLDTTSVDFGSFTSISVGIDTSTISGAVTLKTYLSDSFANLNNWTSEKCGSGGCNGTASVSGGAAVCTGGAGDCAIVSTVTVSGDFLISFKIANSGSANIEYAALNNSKQGYSVLAPSGGFYIGIRRYSDWFNRSSGFTPLIQTSTAPVNGDVITLTRNSTDNSLSVYRNGVFLTSTTDSNYTSFTNVRFVIGAPFGGIDDVYDTARTGNFNSRVMDTTYMAPVYGFLSSALSGTGSSAYALRTSSNPLNSYGADVAITTGTQITNSGKRYIVYSTTITAGGSPSLPQLADVAIPVASSGTFYSAVKNAPNLTQWSTFGANTQTNGGTHAFYMRSSTSVFTVQSTTPSWTSQSNGALVGISTGTYFQVRDDFAITTATDTPTLNDFTVNWFEGSASDQAYSIYFDNAIWFAVAYGAGQSTNNYIFKNDLINDGWTVYNFGTGGFAVQNNSLYFGDTSAGNIFKYGTQNSDNGTAINAYWKSKDFTGNDPWLENQYKQLDSYFTKTDNATATVAYALNTSTTSTSFTVNLSSTTQNMIVNKKLLPSGKFGNTFNYKVSDNSTNGQWEFLGFRMTFDPQPYRPSN